MSLADKLRRIYEANVACGDLGEAEEARLLAEISAAELAEREAEQQAAAA